MSFRVFHDIAADLFPPTGRRVAVAVSGGPDSMALCAALAQGQSDIHALTVDHGLRPESGEEARRVGEWVGRWPHVRHAVLTREPAEDKTRVMEEARRDRYDLMTAYCRDNGIADLYVAHHRDDQAETFLFRLAKGSGLDGLAGMRAVQERDGVRIIRPFLDIPKEELAAACRDNDIPFIEDPSNDDPRYARPRLRAARAVLEREGLSAKRLSVTAARLARAREALDHHAGEAYRNAVRGGTGDGLAFDHATLDREPEEIRLRVLLRAVKALHPDREWQDMERMEVLVAALFAPGDFRRQTLGGVIFSRDLKSGAVTLERETPCHPESRKNDLPTLSASTLRD